MSKYDVVIVGAGMGGLICGTLLAKKGLRVIILEKNSNAGGCCSVFRAGGFRFDAFVHSFGNLSEGSHLNNLFRELGILEKLRLVRINPSDMVFSPDFKIGYYDSVDKTLKSFITQFPHEANALREFFQNLILYENFDSIQEFRNKTFHVLLNKIFKDDRLKQIISLVILGNLGTPPKEISCFTAIKHYRQFMVDGGYYTEGGVDAIPLALANRFQSLGGELFLSRPVNKILVKNGLACGVETKDSKVYHSKYVVSACDMRSTFFDLIGKSSLNESIVNLINRLKPSMSLIVIYLGLKNMPSGLLDRVNNWFIRDYNFDKELSLKSDYVFENLPWFMVRSNHLDRTCVVYASAPARDEFYWRQSRNEITQNILNIVEMHFPGIKENVVFRTSVDPSVLNKWTSNYAGAAYGWASTVDQFMIHEFLRDNLIPNLYLCGHWSSVAQGIPGVAIVAQKVALNIGHRNDKET